MMIGTGLFVSQYIRKEDSCLTYDELVNNYKITNDSRYLAQLFKKLQNIISIVSNKFPSIEVENS